MRPTDTTYLRDWIASAVVAAMIQSDEVLGDFAGRPASPSARAEVVRMARAAYAVADAMLLVREECAQ